MDGVNSAGDSERDEDGGQPQPPQADSTGSPTPGESVQDEWRVHRGLEREPIEPRDAPQAPREPAPGEWDSWTPSPLARGDDAGADTRTGASEPVIGDDDDPQTWAHEARPEDTQRSRQSRTRSFAREFVETGLMALLVFLAVRASFQNYRVHGQSMDPNLQDGEFLLVNRLEYSQINLDRLSKFIPFLDAGSDPERDVFHGPERGDVVILEDPRDPTQDRLVKRVIGLPGETIEIRNGQIAINGHRLIEPYITEPWQGTMPLIRIPQGEYFVMGDNRRNSTDSRFFGLVPRDLIIGKAMLALWPPDKLGLAPNETPKLEAN